MKTAEKEIKEMLYQKGYTASWLSRETGISRADISRYFNGRVEMSANRYLMMKKIISKL